MRDTFSTLSARILVAIGISLLIVPREWLPDFYHPIYMAATCFLAPFLIVLPSCIFNYDTGRRAQLVFDMQSAITFALLINFSGELGLFQLYRFGFEYDKFAHFLVSMLFGLMVCEFLKEWGRFSFGLASVTAFLILFVAGLGWEALEMGSDMLFGTQTFGVNGHSVRNDTLADIIFNILGSVSGIILFGVPRASKGEASYTLID